MEKICTFLLLILALNTNAQIVFEKGYFITNAGDRTDCLIKNLDWKDNPTQFTYKLSDNSTPKEGDIADIKEFSVEGVSKYVRQKVDIDRSSSIIGKLSDSRKALFEKETLFLRVLVEGKATLYSYVDGNLRRFFSKIDDSATEQLVYKSYLAKDNRVGKNERYKQQLLNNLKCSKLKKSKINSIKYKQNSLTRLFSEYNKCFKSDFVSFHKRQTRDVFNLSVRPRIRYSSLDIRNRISNYRDTDFGGKIGFGFGIEAEYILPFNKNKWSITIEPTYQQFISEKRTSILVSNITYRSMEVPMSLRHYIFLNKKSKLFINASVILDASYKSNIDFLWNGKKVPSLDMESKSNWAFGLGYKFDNKYSVEVNYQTSRGILNGYSLWSSRYSTISLILGYSLVRTSYTKK